ncbi:MAG TPA: hypothetical protein VGL25_15390 [Casimicrobiaceae bacterium]|jgi:hypothetical protein
MKTSLIALALVGTTVALSACNQPDTDRTTSIPRGVAAAETVQEPPSGLSAPPAPSERGPIQPNANAAAPGTDASTALANQPNLKDVSTPEKGTAEEQHRAVMAQDAAAKAPDTASADAAKEAVMSESAGSNATGSSETARDSEANNPRSGTITKEEETTQLPKAGQVNNHSSTALEKDSGR